ncbi:hypothetical protein AB4Y64_07575 [Lysobacter sp. TAF61]|uniref:hypothetical protein n=1 Tax=Lysobacter sp. TAF61 TaxID=3233072 RepID=UPI003F956101
MKKTLPLLACTLLIVATGSTLAQQKAPTKKLYCWNENGSKVCGDALPAHAVDSARTEFNAKNGRATGQLARALTDEERAAAAVQAKAEQDAKAAAEVAARRDRAMAESYATEDDLRRAFGERIGVMDETIKASRLGVEGRRQSLISLLSRAGENELSGKPVPKKASDNIQTQHELLLRQRTMLAAQLAERDLIDEDLAAALERYHAMKKN